MGKRKRGTVMLEQQADRQRPIIVGLKVALTITMVKQISQYDVSMLILYILFYNVLYLPDDEGGRSWSGRWCSHLVCLEGNNTCWERWSWWPADGTWRTTQPSCLAGCKVCAALLSVAHPAAIWAKQTSDISTAYAANTKNKQASSYGSKFQHVWRCM